MDLRQLGRVKELAATVRLGDQDYVVVTKDKLLTLMPLDAFVASLVSEGTWQPLDPTLTALAGLATGADRLPYSTGTDAFSQAVLTAYARTLLDDATAAAARTTLGLVVGTDVQAFDATLAALAGLATGADRMPYSTGTDTFAQATLTAFIRTLLDDADAATARATLGAGTSSVAALNDLSDVVIAAPAAGQTLVHDGTDWDNKTVLQGVTLPPFVAINLAASTNVQGDVPYFLTASTVGAGGNNDHKMQKAGRVVGAILTLKGTRTAGTATLKVRVAGTATSFASDAVVLDGTNPTSVSAFVAWASGLAFAAGDNLGVRVDCSAGWTNSGDADALAALIVSFDPF